jgi:acyl-CoA synthetase (AMP-forming)/AMP-acid ligase II
MEADFSPNAVALFLALLAHNAILVPLTSSVSAKRDEFVEIAEAEAICRIDDDDRLTIQKRAHVAAHQLLRALKTRGHPGLILFSSGSTGKAKAAVHDMVALLAKFRVLRQARRAITFLLYDHIGGVNTMLYQLANGGCVVTVRDRHPDAVLAAVERHQVDLLPTSPTFLNLVLLSDAFCRHDVSSLRLVTYGTEPMPESTLRRFHELFPHVELLQTYGLSEVGILRSKSKSSDSLWMKVGGEGFETRVVDRILQIRAASAMLGYLNAPSPFTADGWFVTGDEVEVDGEYIRILGRRSELINVGGEKVYPAEVESVVREMGNVADVTVFGERNAITGQVVCANVCLRHPQDLKAFTRELRAYCASRLEPFKVPSRVKIVTDEMYSARFKKMRSEVAQTGESGA